MAPEVLQDQPRDNEKSVIWSVGMNLCKLLTSFPRRCRSTERASEAGRQDSEADLKHQEIPFPEQFWRSISSQAKDFVTYLLMCEPPGRPSAHMALSHQSLKSAREGAYLAIDNTERAKEFGAYGVLQNIRVFNAASTKLKEAVCSFIVSHLLTPGETKVIDKVFMAFDCQHDGRIHRYELKKVYYHVFSVMIVNKDLDNRFGWHQ